VRQAGAIWRTPRIYGVSGDAGHGIRVDGTLMSDPRPQPVTGLAKRSAVTTDNARLALLARYDTFYSVQEPAIGQRVRQRSNSVVNVYAFSENELPTGQHAELLEPAKPIRQQISCLLFMPSPQTSYPCKQLMLNQRTVLHTTLFYFVAFSLHSAASFALPSTSIR
jgi:hypothetical protein